MGSGRCGGVSVVPPSTRASYTWTTLRQLAHVHNRSTTEGTEHVREAGRSKTRSAVLMLSVTTGTVRKVKRHPRRAKSRCLFFFFFCLGRNVYKRKALSQSLMTAQESCLFFFILFGWPHLCVSNFVIVTSTGTFDWMFFYGSEFIIRKYKAKTVKIPLFNKKKKKL